MGILSCYLLVDLLLVAMDRHRDSEAEKETNLSVFREPYLMRFINFNGLTFFLASNLLTGLINMSFDTIHMTPFGSMTILFVYCNLLGFGSALLYLWRIKLLWMIFRCISWLYSLVYFSSVSFFPFYFLILRQFQSVIVRCNKWILVAISKLLYGAL